MLIYDTLFSDLFGAYQEKNPTASEWGIYLLLAHSVCAISVDKLRRLASVGALLRVASLGSVSLADYETAMPLSCNRKRKKSDVTHSARSSLAISDYWSLIEYYIRFFTDSLIGHISDWQNTWYGYFFLRTWLNEKANIISRENFNKLNGIINLWCYWQKNGTKMDVFYILVYMLYLYTASSFIIFNNNNQ